MGKGRKKVKALCAGPVFVVSGGTGASGLQLVNTVLAQFPGFRVPIEIKAHIRSVEELHEILKSASQCDGIIVHTLVDTRLRNSLNALGETYRVTVIDLMGPLLDRLAHALETEPICRPGLFRSLNRAYFERVEAIEFAIAHDDGQGLADISRADIVLTGVSRVGKTPLAMFLAMQGYKTANVPYVPGQESLDGLESVDPKRVIALLIDPERLVAHRKERKEKLGLKGAGSYSDLKTIFDEIEQAREFFRRKGYSVIDITDKPIETSADEIKKIISNRFEENPQKT